jgi:predicted oxidoreductase
MALITVVGGGMAELVGATTAAETGASVRLIKATGNAAVGPGATAVRTWPTLAYADATLLGLRRQPRQCWI